MSKALKLGIKLLIITAVSALVLAFTNSITEPIIKEADQEKLNESLKVAFPEANNFEEVKGNFPASIVGVYKADGDKGYVFDIISKGGYGGDIEFILGVDSDNKITGFSPLKHSESAGFGLQMEEDWFKEGVKGVSMDNKVGASQSGSENEIVGISGATLSTTSIVNGINTAREVLESIK
ncbi:FMN-binding protein [Anaerococcus sp. AGMB00486]|uniref:Ion-translocating oxidoreductase complex subunit G n=2 Tax=Anaerococcus TaxID=165779 RepID=A0ABX2N8G7_9FIRM|nr:MULTISPECIES: FMN-binding protein [Anaerococcus]MDY3006222.1 FMN-binding protein [Anaerococcus porci]MSS77194.1 FMN-binding protein [Anaerococcus porci]NVF11001.1 FMN-binding protein [Anaerococcus faecalis]